MPYFPSNPLQDLAIEPNAIDQVVELGSLDIQAALAYAEKLLTEAPPGRCLQLNFTPADGNRETLFLPLGRYLLEARREGRLSRCLPVTDGSGFVIQISEP